MTAPALSTAFGPLCSLGLYAGRAGGALVGRPVELAAAEQELTSALGGMVCLTAEGEPGIGKTRLLIAIEELARQRGFLSIAVTSDEEIRGPFLLARSIFACSAIPESLVGGEAERAVQRVIDALASRDEPGFEALAPDHKMLRTFDLAAMALRVLAAEKPLAVLIDDLQWADEDSLRLLRYVVRADADCRILLVFAVRQDELTFVNEAVNLLADMDRLGLRRRLRLNRFSLLESTEFLQRVLGGRIDHTSAGVMHAQAEGVPFILAEQAQSYRDSGLIHQLAGVWTLRRNAERLLPSAVRTLIQRRAARLPDETKACLAEAAPLGKSFSLRDLRELKLRLGEEAMDAPELADAMAPAVAAGLLIQHPDGSHADYTFSHGQIREYAAAGLTPPRRRAIHGAIVDMLLGAGEPPPESLPTLVQHALAAGRSELGVRMAIEAAGAALRGHAPEEVLRLVELAQPVASAPRDRVELLRLQDGAFDLLRRPGQRLDQLAELAALAEALGDSHLELEVMLRRAAALRLSGEEDGAAELAGRVRRLAASRGDREAELAACLEQGQDFMRAELGEAYTQASTEVDLDGAAEAYARAQMLAEALDDDPSLAAATRELGIIAASRVRAWFIDKVQTGEAWDYLRRVAAGETVDDVLATLPILPLALESKSHLRRALEIYERLGDRRGVMCTVIATATISWGPAIHLGGSVKRIEEIRRLMTQMKSLTTESERALADAQMLFGAQVYAQAKGFPDVALTKGQEAYSAARALGERSLEFATAGGMVVTLAQMGAVEDAERWLGRAVSVATAAPTALQARQLELWRGAICAAAGDGGGVREHMERAVQIALEQGLPAARCEAMAQLALAAARLGTEQADVELLAAAERCARDTLTLTPALPGHPPWAAQANAALAQVNLARDNPEAAVEFARAAIAELDGAMREDLFLDILLPACDALLTAGSETEAESVRERLRLTLALFTQRFLDEDVRARWFRGPVGRELTRLAGPLESRAVQSAAETAEAATLDDSEQSLLRLVAQGLTNREIALALTTTEQDIAHRLGELFVKIGATSRADATIAALGKLV